MGIVNEPDRMQTPCIMSVKGLTRGVHRPERFGTGRSEDQAGVRAGSVYSGPARLWKARPAAGPVALVHFDFRNPWL